jgi:glycosyltransferase involved in cell wall biosynthesis
MRVLYIIDFFHPHIGGVPTFFNNLAHNVAKAGHSVTVVTTHAPGTKSVERYKGMKIYRFGKTREQFLIKATMFLIRNKEKYDVVHTSTYSAMIPSYAFSIFKKVPEVLSVHEVWSLKEWLEFTRTKGLFYFLEERVLFSLQFDKYIVPSLHTKHDLEKIGMKSSDISMIPHGIDRDIFNPSVKKFRKGIRTKYLIGPNEVVGCFVGKATVFKGINYLLDALETVLRSVDMRFIFVLSRLHESGYKKFIRRVYGSEILRKNIIVAESSGDHKMIAKIIGASDFIVMPSLTEGFGLAVAEAVSIGIPAIVTKNTSLTEVVEESVNALFVKPRSAKEISNAIIKLTKNRKFARKLSRGKRFKTWGEVAGEYIKVYQEAIKRHKEA